MMFALSTSMPPTMPSSRRSPPARGYHHGDLKNALRRAAAGLIAERGADGVSLREISQAAGVSHTAAYRHYADRQSLLADLAEDGFRELAQVHRDTIAATPGGPVDQLMACGRAYVRFGVERPQVLQLMFGQAIPDWSAYPSLQASATALAQTLAGVVAAGQADGTLRAAPLGHVTLTAWSLVHGLAMLLAGRRIPVENIDDAFVERMAAQCVALLVDGLRA